MREIIVVAVMAVGPAFDRVDQNQMCVLLYGGFMAGETTYEEMVTKKTWQEFRNTGLLWWINRTLHLFGWAIAFSFDDDTGELIEVYPVRCKFRGFGQEADDEGYTQVSEYLSENAVALLSECEPKKEGDTTPDA